jgi:DNA-binding NtrC family response regulator
VRSVATLKNLLPRIEDRSGHYLVIVPQETAGEIIPQILRATMEVPVVVVADEGNVESAAAAIDAGAADFLVLGQRLRERIATLIGKLRQLFVVIDQNRILDAQNAALRSTIQARFTIVGESPQVQQLVDQIQRVAVVPRPVLIVGERGTGKELVARAIHFTAGVDSAAIVTANCAAFTDALLESELFGHEKGAFTGADSARRGKFEQADGGTLFLDEIGHMSLAFQQKILRVVEYGTFTRVGGTTEQKTTVRIIAATNSDLEAKMRAGEFLRDLYDRLSFEVIGVPPLRERAGDVEVLARHFLNQFAREIPEFRGKELSREAISTLNRYRFPGNVRELKNIIERAAYRDTTNEITPNDIGMLATGELIGEGSFRERVDAFSRRLIADALSQSDGNQAAAARQLGLSYHQFRYYYGKYAARLAE